jgi:tetratricopeptide (TPR) repeat protein
MMNYFRPGLLLFALTPLFLFQSCAGIHDAVFSKITGKRSIASSKSPPQKTTLSSKSPAQKTGEAVNRAQKQIEAGQYQKAIDTFNDEYGKQPHDAVLKREYARSLNGVKSTADKRFARGDLAGSGRLYYILHTNYAKFGGIEQALSFDDPYLDAKLAYCKKTLSRQGFEEYRKGNLSNAISVWQGLLAIDPDNNAVKDALRTAIQQQRNLQDNG